MKTFIINRKFWDRGEKSSGSLLCSSTGKMCCLGFFAKSYGVPKDKIVDLAFPSSILEDKELAKIPSWAQEVTTDIHSLVKINDLSDMDDKLREKQIAKIFKKHKIIAKFVG